MSRLGRRRLLLFWYGVGLVIGPELQRFGYSPRFRLARPSLAPRPWRRARL